jgi:hypothetical protein
MPLTIVGDLLAHGGFLPQLAELENAGGSIYTRKNGIAFSLFWLIFWLLIMAVIFGGILNINRLGELFSVIGIFGGLLIFLFSLFFLKRAPKGTGAASSVQPAPALHGRVHQQALPPQPAREYMRPTAGAWRDTNDLEPRSVTESTTQLLAEERNTHDVRRCPSCNTSYTDASLRYCLVDGAPLTGLSGGDETVIRSTNDISRSKLSEPDPPKTGQ